MTKSVRFVLSHDRLHKQKTAYFNVKLDVTKTLCFTLYHFVLHNVKSYYMCTRKKFVILYYTAKQMMS